MQTYTDSSELLKEGQEKVMCMSYCELVKTKPHRPPKGILGRLLYLKLHWQWRINRTESYWGGNVKPSSIGTDKNGEIKKKWGCLDKNPKHLSSCCQILNPNVRLLKQQDPNMKILSTVLVWLESSLLHKVKQQLPGSQGFTPRASESWTELITRPALPKITTSL